MDFAIHDINGKATGKSVKLSPEVFGIAPNEHAIYLDVKHFLANQRQGTAKAKARAEVSYSTKKIKRQKGTGGARSGSIKSPLYVGGGRVFGPEPRDYGFKLNKKVKRLARLSALSAKAGAKSIVVLEDLNFSAPKTKTYTQLLRNLELTGKKTLMVTSGVNSNLVLSARNVERSKVVTTDGLNTYDILNAGVLLLSESAVNQINEQFKA